MRPSSGRSLLAAAAILLVFGCAPARRSLVREKVLKSRIVSHPDVRFMDLDAFHEGEVLLIAGSVQRRDGLTRASGGHIDLAILDAKGSSLSTASTETNPSYTSRYRASSFKFGFQIQPPVGGTFAAAFHVLAKKAWKGPADCGANRALGNLP